MFSAQFVLQSKQMPKHVIELPFCIHIINIIINPPLARRTPFISCYYFHAWMGTMFIIYFPQFVLTKSDWLSPFSTDVAQMEHGALHFTSREKPLLVILYVFSVLFITTLTAGVKWETSRKNLPRLPSGKVELKLERGITWTKAPLGREWEWKRKERKGDRSSVMGCRCSVLGMIKQWGWIRALSYDKHMHTHIHTQTHSYTPLCLTI